MSRVLQEGTPEYRVLNSESKDLYVLDLLATIIGGKRGKVLAEKLVGTSSSLREIAKLNPQKMVLLGLTESDAARVKAAFSLGGRMYMEDKALGYKIDSSQYAYNLMAPFIRDLPHEEFWILLLKRNNTVIKRVQISKGGVSGTVVDPKLVFKPAIEHGASAIILVHNHPSGNTKPSTADEKITKKLKEVGETLECSVLDHIIIGGDRYYSFADEGIL